MSKVMLVASLTFAVSVLTAAEVSHEETIEESNMKLFGGYVRKPNSARGKVLFVNAQKRVSLKDLQGVFEEIDDNLKFDYSIKGVEKIKLPNPRSEITALGGTLGVALIDRPEYPALVAAPEDGWAIVNVAALDVGGVKANKLAARVRKETLRALGMIGGCAFMARGAYVMKNGIRTPRDLDTIQLETYGVDALSTFEKALPLYGVMPWTVATYEDACQQGWAPAPTNEYQKAIWDKVHTIPTKPIKIEYNEKRDKGK